MRALVLVMLVACSSSSSSVSRRAPAADDAVGILIDAFHDHSLVALDEGGHGNEAIHAFIDSVLRDPRLAGTANDLVVEFGSARYQNVIDRFVAGESVPEHELRKVWQDTTQVFVWESPLYERFFRTVREVNAKLPAAQRFRVVLADPPIDWTTVVSWKDWARYQRDAHAAVVIEREVLARGRKALLVFGASHLARRNIQVNYEPAGMLVERLEERHPNAVFAIYASPLPERATTCAGEQESCPTYTLTRLASDPLGAEDFASILGDAAPRARFDHATGKPVDASKHVAMPFAKVFDAILSTGPAPITFAEPTPLVFADEAYYRETVRRSHILRDMNLAAIESLRERYLSSCARAAC